MKFNAVRDAGGVFLFRLQPAVIIPVEPWTCLEE
jgi:hypothetical protein